MIKTKNGDIKIKGNVAEMLADYIVITKVLSREIPLQVMKNDISTVVTKIMHGECAEKALDEVLSKWHT